MSSTGHCPYCHEDSGVELSFDNLSSEDLICQNCGCAVQIEHDYTEDYDLTFWLAVREV